jgi:transposase
MDESAVADRQVAAQALQAEGFTQKEIGTALGVSRETIRTDAKKLAASDKNSQQNKSADAKKLAAVPLDTVTALAATNELRQHRPAKTVAPGEDPTAEDTHRREVSQLHERVQQLERQIESLTTARDIAIRLSVWNVSARPRDDAPHEGRGLAGGSDEQRARET